VIFLQHACLATMKHPGPAAWSIAPEGRPGVDAPAEKSPMQLMLFEVAADSIAEAPLPRLAPIEEHPGASEKPGATAFDLAASLDPVVLTSDDSVLKFRLVASAAGVVVNRTHRRTRHERVDMSLVFGSEARFLQWCEADHLRHTYPLLFAQLRRSGCALFDRRY
jgi:hypothetical protein